MKKRLLVSTAMMLALTAIATSTSTYAWFTANKTATLAGPTLTAQSSAGIKVSVVKGSDASTNKLTPISGDGKTFFVANSNTVGSTTYLSSITSTTSGYWDVIVQVDFDGSSDETLSVKLDTADTNTFVKAKPTGTAADAAAANSVRVAVFTNSKIAVSDTSYTINDDAADFYWAPNEGESNTQKYLKAASTSDGVETKVSNNVSINDPANYPTGCVGEQSKLTQLNSNNTNSTLATISSTTSTAYIGFRVWLEGMDADCDNDAINGQFDMNFCFKA